MCYGCALVCPMSISESPDPLGVFGRPTRATRWTDLTNSVRPTRRLRSTDFVNSVDRPRHFGGPTLPTRSTEFDHLQASRQCQPRVCSMPRYAQTNTSVRTNQEGRVGASFDWLFRVLRLALLGCASSPFHFADWLNLPRCQYLPQFAALGLSIEHRAAMD